MSTNEYEIGAIEVLNILYNTANEDLVKIPNKFIDFLINIANKEYLTNLDYTKAINDMNISDAGKELLGLIYINWWCDESEKKGYKKKIEIIEEERQNEIRKKYNPDNILEKYNQKQKVTENIVATNMDIVEHKEPIFKKIINTIKKFFHIN